MNKFILLILITVGFLYSPKNIFADNCTSQKPGYVCTNISNVNSPNANCVTKLCTGGSDRLCCKQSALKTAQNTSSSSTTQSTAAGTIVFKNPLAYNNAEDFISNIIVSIRNIIVAISILFIVYGGLLYVISAGNKDLVEKGKKSASAAVIGLAIALAAPSILKEVVAVIGWLPGNNTEVNNAQSLSQIIMNVLSAIFSLMGLAALIMMVLGGVFYLLSAGDDDMVKKGKTMFTNAVIGLILAMSALIIVKQVAQFFIAQ